MVSVNVTRLTHRFAQLYPQAASPTAASAPGRVNLIGEHTDYNDGFVLPMAINDRITLVGSLQPDRRVDVYSSDYEDHDVFSLEDIALSAEHPWSNYIRGICAMFRQRGFELQGMCLLVSGRVPQGAGLSSSAALEVAAAELIAALHDIRLDPIDLVHLAQQAENDFVGVQCGIMDQFIAKMGRANHALFLDCRSLDYRRVPILFPNTTFAVIDSGVKRGLVDSEYNRRRTQCQEAVTALQDTLPGITALRDVSADQLGFVEKLPEELCKRARHVITENERVKKAVHAMETKQTSTFGQLMYQSHASLRDDYEVSIPALDTLVELAEGFPGVLGSRMTGAGFGGCTVTLIEQEQADSFATFIASEYQKRFEHKPRIFFYEPSSGAVIHTG